MTKVGVWRLNGNTNDSSWNGNNMSGGSWTSVTKQGLNWAYSFSGSNGIKTGTQDLFLSATSVSLYCTVNSSSSGATGFIITDWNYISIMMNLNTSDGKASCFTDGNSWTFAKSKNSLLDWKYHRVVLTANSTTVNCYVDWVFQNTAANTLNTGSHSRVSAIAMAIGWGNYFTGIVDEVVFVKNEYHTGAQVKNDFMFQRWFI